jgi:UPF0755 protein
MRKLLRFLLAVAVIALVTIGSIAYWLTRPVTLAEDTFVEINRGTSTRRIADQLTQQGVIRSPYELLALRALRPGSRLQAGEYEFSGTLTAWEVFEKIRLGQVFYEEVTVPEGSNIFDIAALLDNTDSIESADFLVAAKDPSMVKDLDAAAPSLEGYLFPSSYRVTHTTTARDLCRMMTQEFRRQWKALQKSAEPAAHMDVHQTVILASLVEKETAIPQERPLVAAVFANRLQLNMPLQCDPTTVYAALLENRYEGVIHKSDLASNNAYNTYAHSGLPPGPIGNPGALSLKAALDPAKTNVLYFVAKGDGSGTHHFSATLAEHEIAVLQYRKTQH